MYYFFFVFGFSYLLRETHRLQLNTFPFPEILVVRLPCWSRPPSDLAFPWMNCFHISVTVLLQVNQATGREEFLHIILYCDFFFVQVKIWFQNRRAKERKVNKKKMQSQQASTTTPTPPAVGSTIGMGPLCSSSNSNMVSPGALTIKEEYLP